jgi:hypothetical protein
MSSSMHGKIYPFHTRRATDKPGQPNLHFLQGKTRSRLRYNLRWILRRSFSKN